MPPKKITVQKRDNTRFEGIRPGADRPSVVGDTIDASREILQRSGGGELAVRRVSDGRIRQQDTIPPARDPRKSRG